MQNALLLNLIATPFFATQVPTAGLHAQANLGNDSYVRPHSHQLPSGNLPVANKNAACSALTAIKAYAHGWDGPGSRAALGSDVQAARMFVESLPDTVSLPNISLAHDGEVNVSWRSDDLFIDLSFIGDESFGFARIDKRKFKSRGGWLRFDALPNEIRVAISAVDELVV